MCIPYHLFLDRFGTQKTRLTHHAHNSQGFTLVSLLITIVIMAILAGVSGYTHIRQMAKHRLNGAAKHIEWDLKGVRMQAILQKHNISVNFTNNSMYTIWIDKNDNSVSEESEKEVRDIQNDYKGINISSTHDLTFEPSGMIYNPPIITLSNSNKEKTITFTNNGSSGVN